MITDLTWNPRVMRPGVVNGKQRRGALVGTLLGVPVDGWSCGRAVAYQFVMVTGEVRTGWWDGTMYGDSPCLFDVDTDESLLRNPASMVSFARLESA